MGGTNGKGRSLLQSFGPFPSTYEEAIDSGSLTSTHCGRSLQIPKLQQKEEEKEKGGFKGDMDTCKEGRGGEDGWKGKGKIVEESERKRENGKLYLVFIIFVSLFLVSLFFVSLFLVSLFFVSLFLISLLFVLLF